MSNVHTALDASATLPRVAIVGGGLAGLAAAVGLCQQRCQVDLYEARRQLGGRATSYQDGASGELVDHCQHVSMGCCVNLADFCRRTGLAGDFRTYDRLHFFGPDGRRFDLSAQPGLPAPLHLGPSLMRLGYLSLAERFSIAWALWRLARWRGADDAGQPTIGAWLRRQGQTQRAMDRFWGVVLVSALGETLDRASLAQAKKVFVDGFMTARSAWQVQVPAIPLGDLYGARLAEWLKSRGVSLHLGSPVKKVLGAAAGITELELAGGERREVEAVVLALPWYRVRDSLGEDLSAALPELASLDHVESAPITAVHLWFDRAITPLPHAVLVDRLSQWIFRRGDGAAGEHYYQVVISASRSLAGRDRDEAVKQVVHELGQVWPAARDARLLRSKMVTEHNAVFSVRPGLEQIRPLQQTRVRNLFLAGDWTRTGWPSTMEGAVRSGYLAAEAVCQSLLGRRVPLLQPDLPRSWLSRWLLR